MSNTDFSEQWKSMQQMFLLNFHHSESMRENARRFWENQNNSGQHGGVYKQLV
jgi:hypothetical protein